MHRHFAVKCDISTIYERLHCDVLAAAVDRAGGTHAKFAIASRPFRGPTDKWIMANRVYCTYFDHNYLSRGLALYHSLQRHAPGARLWVLCLSEACHRILIVARSAEIWCRCGWRISKPPIPRSPPPDRAEASSNITSPARRPGCFMCWNASRTPNG